MNPALWPEEMKLAYAAAYGAAFATIYQSQTPDDMLSDYIAQVAAEYAWKAAHRVPVWCRQCGNPVEDARRCYATPMCFNCLPPPKLEEPNK